jgi:protein tyrosine/serine phosphatase
MSANELARCIRTCGIKSVLNLRGENTDASWHQAEIAVTRKLNVSHYDQNLSSGTELSIEQTDEIVSLLRRAPKPILIHCDGGADRSALVSALYLFAVEGQTSDEANNELSIWNGHLPSVWPRATAMDRSFWQYVRNRTTNAEAKLQPQSIAK